MKVGEVLSMSERSPNLTISSLILLVSIWASGCAPSNIPLNDLHLQPSDRRDNCTRAAMFSRTSHCAVPGDRDGCFVGLALSGGGLRAANFSSGCMFQMQRLGLLQKVDYISSVSGGSLAAGYYCTHGSEWNPAIVQQELTHSFASDAIGQSLLPWNALALLFGGYNRTELIAAVLQNALFMRDGRPLTFGDLRPDRPRLLINATDLQSGRRFVFSNESFDDLNSDLSKYPIASAVAAGAAVPVILHPLTLVDYSTIYDQYLHLIDGGVADDLGIQTLLDTYTAQLDAAKREGRPDPYPNGAVFIVVDSHTRFNAHISGESDIGVFENLRLATGLTGSTLIGRVNIANMSDLIVHYSPDDVTAAQMREEMQQLADTGYIELRGRSGHFVRVIYLSLQAVGQLKNLPYSSFGQSVNGIPTYFNIPQKQAAELYEAADLLVKARFEDKIRQIVHDLDATAGTRSTTETQSTQKKQE